jgi:mRNA-degrading endonuclease RelE of RelBE toxin-antitoxin system
MTYTLNIDEPALKVFKRLSLKAQRFIINKAQLLKSKPFAGKQLEGKHRLLYTLHCRFEAARYHIIYQALREQETVVVRLVGTRENIYRKLDEMKVTT